MSKNIFLKKEDLFLEQYISIKNDILADVLFSIYIHDDNVDLSIESLKQIIINNFDSENELKSFLNYYKIEGYEKIMDKISSSISKPPLRSLYNLRKVILDNIENKKLFNEDLHDFLDALDEGNQMLSKKYFKRLNNIQKSIIEPDIIEWININ